MLVIVVVERRSELAAPCYGFRRIFIRAVVIPFDDIGRLSRWRTMGRPRRASQGNVVDTLSGRRSQADRRRRERGKRRLRT